MVVKEVVLIGGLGVVAWIALSAFSSRIPNPVEAVEDAGEAIGKAGEAIGETFTANNDTVTGETPAMKGALRNTEDFFFGDGSSAARIQREMEQREVRNAKGAVGNTFDFALGDGFFEGFVNRQSAHLRNFFGLEPFEANTQPEAEEQIVAVSTSKNPNGRRRFGQ